MQLFLRHIYLIGLLFPFLSCSTTRICSDYISPSVHASDFPGALNECQAYPDSLSGLDVYFYVDTFPTYNNRPWIEELGKDFNRKFTYKYSEGEELCVKAFVQFVINKEGKLVAPRIIECKNDSFAQAVLETLNSCQGSWTSGIVGEINVNTMLYMPIVW